MRPKKKYAVLLEQKPYKTFDEPPADDIVIDHSEWEHANYIIKQTLQDFELHPTEAVEHYSFSGLPFLGWFKTSLNCRIKHQNRTFAPHEEFEPTMAAINAVHMLQDLLKNSGSINPEKAKVFLLSLQLMLGILHSGYLPEMFSQELKRHKHYRNGPGAASREVGEWKIEKACKVLEKYGGYWGYKSLPYGGKTPVREEIQKAIKAKDIRNVDNIIKKIGTKFKGKN
ncbi:MAG: hypothetical protein A4E71_00215 [Smithella sp. PtaU1.Bin162]|nr:MAG: hypothetical protein A4E71_00215 [Smithella sp. PtaU1.Bin162]